MLQTLHFVILAHILLRVHLVLYDNFLVAHQTPPRRLWLRDSSDPIVILGPLGPFRCTWPVKHHLRSTQAPQIHFDALSPLGTTLVRHPRPIQIHLAHQALSQAHLGTLGLFKCTWPITHFLDHPRSLKHLSDSPKLTQVHLSPLRFTLDDSFPIGVSADSCSLNDP